MNTRLILCHNKLDLLYLDEKLKTDINSKIRDDIMSNLLIIVNK